MYQGFLVEEVIILTVFLRVWQQIRDLPESVSYTHLISFVREEDKRKIYEITALGREVLEIEKKRIDRLYRNMKENSYER